MRPVPCGLRAATIVVKIIGTIAVTTAVTWSGEPWPIGRGGVEDGARRGVLCHGCAWRVEGGGVEEMRCCEGGGKEDEGGGGAHGDGWAGVSSQDLRSWLPRVCGWYSLQLLRQLDG